MRPSLVTLEQENEVARSEFEDLLRKNVDAITRIEQAAQASRTRADIVADAIAGFCGSIAFVWVHCLFFGGWLLWNGLSLFPHPSRIDPPPFSVLNLIVSLEAIFLSTFILVSQNRQQRTADQRNHLDLQINILAEQETSHMLAMMKQMMDYMGIRSNEPKTEALLQVTDPEMMADHILGSDESD